MRPIFPASVFGGALLLASGAAMADAIDGHWCTEAGLRMSIQGVALVSPGGARLTGDYTRHAFSYVAPAGEPGGGGRMNLRLLNENSVAAQAETGAIEPLWRRCGPPVS